jgi:hypothetical protein
MPLLHTLRRAAWAPILVFGLHMLSAQVLGLYDSWPPLDIPMHFFGGVAITWFFVCAYRTAEELGFLGRPAALLFRNGLCPHRLHDGVLGIRRVPLRPLSGHACTEGARGHARRHAYGDSCGVILLVFSLLRKTPAPRQG